MTLSGSGELVWSQSAPEHALQTLADDAVLAAPYELAGLIDTCARGMGARGASAHLADMQQRSLIPFVSRTGAGQDAHTVDYAVDAGRTLTETMNSIDAALFEGLAGEVFSTAVMLELDTDTGRLEWANAGHPEPRLPLGLGDLMSSDLVSIGFEQLEPGDQLLLYTDGVVEARSPDGEFFGVDRLADLVIRHLAGGLSAPGTVRRVVRELLEHQQDQLTDDASLLLLEWRSGSEGELVA